MLHSLCMISPALEYRTGRNNWSPLCLIPDHSPPSIFGCYLSPLSQFPLLQPPSPWDIHSFIPSLTFQSSSEAFTQRAGLCQPLMAWQPLSPFSSLDIGSLILTREWILLKGIPSQGLNDLLNFLFLNFLSHTKMSFYFKFPTCHLVTRHKVRNDSGSTTVNVYSIVCVCVHTHTHTVFSYLFCK